MTQPYPGRWLEDETPEEPSMEGVTAYLTIPWTEDGMGGKSYDLGHLSQNDLADLITNSIFAIVDRSGMGPLEVLGRIKMGVMLGLATLGIEYDNS